MPGLPTYMNPRLGEKIKPRESKSGLVKAGRSLVQFLDATMHADVKEATRIYHGLPGYAKDRLWAVVPYKLLPEEKKRQRDKETMLAADWKGATLMRLLDDIMNEGAAQIYAKAGKIFKNEDLDVPFSKIFQASARKRPAPGRVLKVGPEEDPQGFAVRDPNYGMTAQGWPNENPLYQRRPFVTMNEKGGFTLVLPKGAEHFEAGPLSKRVWGYNAYDEVSPGLRRIEYDVFGNRITHGEGLPQHGWLYRDSPTTMNLETGLTKSSTKEQAKSIYNLLREIFTNAEGYGDVEPSFGYFARFNNYQPYATPSSAIPSSIEIPPSPTSMPNTFGFSGALEAAQNIRPSSVPVLEDSELLRAISELTRNVPSSSALVTPNAAQNSFLRWLDEQGVILGPGASNIMPYSSLPGSYGYNAGHFPSWLDWVNHTRPASTIR